MTYLVTGASRGYGKMVASRLHELGHEVYEAQRTPGSVEIDLDLKLRYWRECNWEDPPDVLRMVNGLLARRVELDGVFFAAAHILPQNINRVNAFDLQEHLMVNVSLPVISLLYMVKFGVLKHDARVMFCLDRRELSNEYVCYAASKAAIPSVIEAFVGELPEAMKIIYVALPARDAGAKAVEDAVEVLIGAAKSRKILDLTE